MILGTLNDLTPIEQLGGNFLAAASYLKKLNTADLTPGHYEVDGADVFANFYHVTLESPDTLSFETHTHYADIQIITDGCEGMWYAPLSSALTVRAPYEAERDVTFYNDPAQSEELAVRAGQYAVFLPDDAHKPSCQTGNSSYSHKLVIKVRID